MDLSPTRPCILHVPCSALLLVCYAGGLGQCRLNLIRSVSLGAGSGLAVSATGRPRGRLVVRVLRQAAHQGALPGLDWMGTRSTPSWP